jgi:thermostable 8-oxoguanine DNA glycosylase
MEGERMSSPYAVDYLVRDVVDYIEMARRAETIYIPVEELLRRIAKKLGIDINISDMRKIK